MVKPLKRIKRSSLHPISGSKIASNQGPDQNGPWKSQSGISSSQVAVVSALGPPSPKPRDEVKSRSSAPKTPLNVEPEKVGYRNPPKSTQFKKGQSGNPKGRQKGLKNPETLWREHLSAKVRVVENGREMKKSKQELIVITTINKAVKGDHKATLEVLKQSSKYLTNATLNSPSLDGAKPDQFSPIDKLILKQLHLEKLYSVTANEPDEVENSSRKLKDNEANGEGGP